MSWPNDRDDESVGAGASSARGAEAPKPRDAFWRSPAIASASIAAVATIVAALIGVAASSGDDSSSTPSSTARIANPEEPPTVSSSTVPGTVTDTGPTDSPSAAAPVATPRRSGQIILPHGAGYSVDLDASDPDWRYGADQYRIGLDLVANCCDVGLTANSGIVRVEIAAEQFGSPEVADMCKSSTGYTGNLPAPRADDVFCIRTDESRVVVIRIVDAGLESGKVGFDAVVW